MPESIKLCARAVRPSGRSGLDDEHALPGQTRTGDLDLIDVDLERGGNGCGRKFAADDAGRGQQVTVALGQLVDLAVDEAAHVVRDCDDRARRSTFLLRKLIDDTGHEQRIAAGPLQQERRHFAQLRSAAVVAEPSLQIACDGRKTERSERDFSAPAMQREFRHQAAEAHFDSRHVSRPKRCDYHEAGGLGAACHMG